MQEAIAIEAILTAACPLEGCVRGDASYDQNLRTLATKALCMPIHGVSMPRSLHILRSSNALIPYDNQFKGRHDLCVALYGIFTAV